MIFTIAMLILFLSNKISARDDICNGFLILSFIEIGMELAVFAKLIH